jgi:hypothetical protein
MIQVVLVVSTRLSRSETYRQKEAGFDPTRRRLMKKDSLSAKSFRMEPPSSRFVGATIGNTGLLAYDMCFTDSIVELRRELITGTDMSSCFCEVRNTKFAKLRIPVVVNPISN